MTALIVKDNLSHQLFVGVTNSPRKLIPRFYNDMDLSIMMFHTEGKDSIYEVCHVLHEIRKFLVIPFSDMWYLSSTIGEPAPLTDLFVPLEEREKEFDLSCPVLKSEQMAFPDR